MNIENPCVTKILQIFNALGTASAYEVYKKLCLTPDYLEDDKVRYWCKLLAENGLLTDAGEAHSYRVGSEIKKGAKYKINEKNVMAIDDNLLIVRYPSNRKQKIVILSNEAVDLELLPVKSTRGK